MVNIKRWLGYMALLCFTMVTYVTAFPPFAFKEGAFLFAVPLIAWASRRNKGRNFYVFTFLCGWCAWWLLLIWLRHVYPPWGWLGCGLLSLVVSLFWSVWFWAVGRYLPNILGQKGLNRALGMFALAGFWVVLEWVRAWLLTGFPWLTLAASQWQNPAILQPAAWTGAYGVSFVIIFFNLGLFFYGNRIYQRIAGRTAGAPCSATSGVSRRWPWCASGEFYCALALLLGSLGLFVWQFPQADDQEPMFEAGMVQPWIPAEIKWEEAWARENLAVLQRLTKSVARLQPDVIVWPEAATPMPIINSQHNSMQLWVEDLVREVGIPLLSGNLAERGGVWHNGFFLIEPDKGLLPAFNTKQRLVPFGEYVPLRAYLPFISKLVPIAGDIVAAAGGVTLPLQVEGHVWAVGSLICYEDIFPHLARATVRAGADCMVVVTNDAWYGEEGGAYQHAAHSVLRAVETRRPVIRCGNHGWSGWIDEYGRIRATLLSNDGSIYFQGVASISVSRDRRWSGQQSFYVRYGDWFVGVCGLAGLSFLLCARCRRGDTEEPESGKCPS